MNTRLFIPTALIALAAASVRADLQPPAQNTQVMDKDTPAAATRNEITVAGTRFRLNGADFPYTGISFFNAIYNPAFNRSAEERTAWLRKFRRYGINVLRVWAQWDNKRGFVDAGPESTLYHPDGRLRAENLARLKAILAAADREG